MKSAWYHIQTFLIIIIRSIIVGGLTVLALVFNVDFFTDSSYGVMTLVIIVCCFVFFTAFTVLTVELFFFFIRKERKQGKKTGIKQQTNKIPEVKEEVSPKKTKKDIQPIKLDDATKSKK